MTEPPRHELEGELRKLPEVFTYREARKAGMSKRALYRLRENRRVDPLSRGLYRRVDRAPSSDTDLQEIAIRAPRATLCLAAALSRHGLIDDIPATIDLALPRGVHRPATTAPVTWHQFDPATFDVGRDVMSLSAQTSLGIYSPERSIVDAFRLRHREGPELGYTALKRWLGRPGASPYELLRTARHFPATLKALHGALEILL